MTSSTLTHSARQTLLEGLGIALAGAILFSAKAIVAKLICRYGLPVINAVFCTVLPVFVTVIAVSRIGAATASQAGMAGPVSSLFMAAAIQGEPITAIQLAGTALELSGIYLLSRKKA
jgi:hypothetical protein